MVGTNLCTPNTTAPAVSRPTSALDNVLKLIRTEVDTDVVQTGHQRLDESNALSGC